MRNVMLWFVLLAMAGACPAVFAEQIVLSPRHIVNLHASHGSDDWTMVKFDIDPGLDTALIDLVSLTGTVRSTDTSWDNVELEVASVSGSWLPTGLSRGALERLPNSGVDTGQVERMPVNHGLPGSSRMVGLELKRLFKANRRHFCDNGLRVRARRADGSGINLSGLDSLQLTIYYTIPHPDFRER
jgi:hypothetical protein